jgi:hypothetical protein
VGASRWLTPDFKVALALQDDPIPDTIALTAREKIRKEQLERVVEHGLAQFLEVGKALAELRSRRLYRTHFATFEDYVRTRFGLARSSVDQLIRSASTAQCLLDNGLDLPESTTESMIRPISALPGDELKVACWQFAQSLAPECGVTQPLVSRLCRVVRNVLEGAPQEDFGEQERAGEETSPSRNGARLNFRRQVTSPERETPFIRPVERLASWSGFSVEVIVSSVKAPSALILFRACSVLTDRLKQVQERLAANYPELTANA